MTGENEKVVLRLFRFPVDERECCGCNWKVTYLHAIARTEEEAMKIVHEDEMGLCAHCINEELVNYVILTQDGLETLKKELDDAITAIEEWNEGRRDLNMGDLFDRLVRLQRILEN